MEYRDALRITMTVHRIKGKDLALSSGVSPSQISAYRNGSDLNISSFQAVINAMPPEARQYFYNLVASQNIA